MSTLWTKISDIATEFKQICLEQIWLIALLTPLVVLATIGAMQWQSSNSKNAYNKAEALVQAITSNEISSAEMAMIVAKPLGELLIMQVYSTARRGDELVVELTTEDVFRNGANNKMLVTQHRRNQADVVTYLQPLKNKKIQKVVGQS